ncbi:hypothetical protein OS493_027453 [Desmophyllum pertusum]|uniref:Nucleolar 27S pre-rRNA processing Urb2/Npa2 C-terminal domain-containing protein n=1 Tax=Desmophyllum pertusum TaxID=174260 RepID=A0A9W9Y9R0_9CNID|nr:hypothetical protein OS493_027453 [Desmophyllum pertusum]
MARLYQEISSHKKLIFQVFSLHDCGLYSWYPDCCYSFSYQGRSHSWVYCLLDLCGEHELSLLHAVLEKGSRELFHSLHADYTKYHKFKGKSDVRNDDKRGGMLPLE